MDQTMLLGMIAGLLVAVMALLIAVLVRQGRRGHAAAAQLHSLGNALLDELDAQHGNMEASLRASSDSLGATLANIGQGQTGLLESIQRQVALGARGQEERLSQGLGQLEVRMEQLRQATEGSLTALRQENDRQLTEMRKTVDEKLTETLNRRLTDSFSQVSQRLEQVYKGLGEMQSLAVGVGDLKKVLTNVKTRGIWGEMQLGALLAQLLAPEQYDENVAVVPGRAERVEYAVKLPGRDEAVMYLPIDSKFPQEDYMRLVDASQQGDAEAVEAARKALWQAIRVEAKRIAGKYVVPPHTTDFAIMFLPVEGLYAEAVQSPALMEAIQREQRVVVAGPSTLAALLNALQMGFRTLAIEKRSSEVWKLLREVKQDFGLFADTLEKTQQRLRQASDSIDTAFTRTRSIQRRLGSLEEPESIDAPKA